MPNSFRSKSRAMPKGQSLRKRTSHQVARTGYGATDRLNDHGAPLPAKISKVEEAEDPAMEEIEEVVYRIPRNSTDQSAPTMPALEIHHTGWKKTSLTTEVVNLDLVAKRLNRDPEAVLEFLADKLQAHHYLRKDPHLPAGRRYYIRGTHSRHVLQARLDEYISAMVLCSGCQCAETSITVNAFFTANAKSGRARVFCEDCAVVSEVEWEPESESGRFDALEDRDVASSID